MKKREFEEGIVTDLSNRMTYEGYLELDRLLDAQRQLSQPPHHDEMLFIVQHQVAELWLKLILHEIEAAMRALRDNAVDPAIKVLSRVKIIQVQMINQWSVLESLTPSEYAQFRGVLGSASGFQSFQYRKFEFLLGNRDERMLAVFGHDPAKRTELARVMNSPGLYDEFLRCLYRQGHAVPEHRVERDWSQPADSDDGVVAVFKRIYENTDRYWDAYELAETLLDIEVNLQRWRFRHVKTVERIIGYKKGTGGSSGVPFLRRALDIQLFPELYHVRTEIGA
jgi:tryptophan 2,3-dioxygenase